MSDLAISRIPLTELDEFYMYGHALVALYEDMAAAYAQVGYPTGPSETGPTTGGPGHGDPTAAQVGRDGRLRDDHVRMRRAQLHREFKWIQRPSGIAGRTPRLFRELDWQHPNLQREIEQGYREQGGRLYVVGGD